MSWVHKGFGRSGSSKLPNSPRGRSLRPSLVGLLAVVFACAGGRGALAAVETRFTVVNSSGSSWVARGYHDYTVDATRGWTITGSQSNQHVVGFNITGTPLPGTSVDYWRLNFAAPAGAQLTPGHYPDLQRYPFQSSDHPGLEFASTGRLDNQAGGFFDVYEATYGPGGALLSFSANFTHYGETNPNNWAIAEIRFNASVPEPQQAFAVIAAAGATLLIRRRLGQSKV
jgi:hypothetical protein